jgi:predicted nucleotidyltransferase
MNDTIKALLSELKSGPAQIYAERLRDPYLFGSYATAQQQPDSDLDVLIILDRLDSYGA